MPSLVTIPLEHPALDSISGVLHEPAVLEGGPVEVGRGSAILLAHGAGADMETPFIVAMAEGLAQRGFPTLRFRYPYMERAAREGRKFGPDRAPRLEDAHRAALLALREHAPGKRALLCGKSMGGRMGTHLAAQGADAAGLVLLGYPLHPPNKPERERSEHFPAIVQPALFLQGTRDALCNLDNLRRALGTYGGNASLEVIEGGDHGFAVPRRTGRTRDEVWSELLQRIDDWERRTFPS